MTSPTSSPCHHPLRNHHSNGHHHHHHRGSIDSVFVDLDLSGSGTEFGAGSGLASALGSGLSNDGISGVVDLRALAKDRQKKDNHNMSKRENLILLYLLFWVRFIKYCRHFSIALDTCDGYPKNSVCVFAFVGMLCV